MITTFFANKCRPFEGKLVYRGFTQGVYVAVQHAAFK